MCKLSDLNFIISLRHNVGMYEGRSEKIKGYNAFILVFIFTSNENNSRLTALLSHYVSIPC
jgi:hypothetical protein